MKLLVTGAAGLLGLNLALDAARSHEVVGLDRNRLASVPFQLEQIDLLERGSIERAVQGLRPDALVHCAAAADVDYCEGNPEAAARINVDVPARIGRVCERAGVRLVHISTDAVFDGLKDGSYSETDVPNPIGVYARTKHEAEAAVMSENAEAIVARVNFYGWSVGGKRSLAEFFVNNLRRRAAVRGFTDVVGSCCLRCR
jgi:dTDP-4-dehydrorhamnose reductase